MIPGSAILSKGVSTNAFRGSASLPRQGSCDMARKRKKTKVGRTAGNVSKAGTPGEAFGAGSPQFR